MTYMTVKDLKQTRRMWSRLSEERELVITRDGKPCAIMVEVTPDTCDESLAEIRRSLFSSAVSRIRRKGAGGRPTDGEIEDIIKESREKRGL